MHSALKEKFEEEETKENWRRKTGNASLGSQSILVDSVLNS